MPAAVIQQWPAPLDPQDIKDYASDFTPEMTATSDTIIGSTFALSSAAQAAGILIHSQAHDTVKGIVFLKVDAGSQGDAAWDGLGTLHNLTHTITTQGGRTLSKTLIFLVQAQ